MYLKVSLGSVDLEHNFSCSWSQVVKAFERALGAESKAKYIEAFFAEESNLIGGESVENTLYMINALVDRTFDSIDKVYAD